LSRHTHLAQANPASSPEVRETPPSRSPCSHACFVPASTSNAAWTPSF
jgi:hypothetical protein